MMKFLKWFTIVVVSLVVLLFIAFKVMESQTKKHSPEQIESLKVNDLEITIFYNRPSKKDREIFGGLVPFGEVWRTGANEPTTFTVNEDISVEGQPLPAGEYSLWTIPGTTEWEVIFSKGEYSWGVAWGGKASRLPEDDVLNVKVPVRMRDNEVEMLTIELMENPMIMAISWDKTIVEVHLN